MFYVAIGILAIVAVSITLIPRGSPGLQSGSPFGNLGNSENPAVDNSKEQSIKAFKERFCGDGRANSNSYVTELVLPSECELPLGITVGDGRVWYVSTKHGTLGSYNLSDKKFEEYLIPAWPARSDPTDFNMAWAAKADGRGNVWFTDDRQGLLWRFNIANGTFDSFKSPASNPISFDFDADGNVYLVGVRSKALYFAEVSKMQPGTSDGFTEIKLPLDAFANIEQSRVSSGSVAVDRERDAVWTTVLAFQQKGQVFRYDVATKDIRVFDLPQELNSPVGTTVDAGGNLWVTDHGTNIFFKVDAGDGSMTRYVTSIASPRIYGGESTPPNAYTLPYWIGLDSQGNIWFNQHTGNKISRFDPSTETTTEYWVPTQNELWANCPEGAQICGLANVLQMSVAPDGGRVWFTEWSENKIGYVDAGRQVPFSVAAPQDEITVKRGDSAEIKLDVSSSSSSNGAGSSPSAARMIASSNITPTGGLGDSTGIFSQQSVELPAGGSRQVSYVFTPAASLPAGQYILMLGAENDEVSVLKAVRVNVV